MEVNCTNSENVGKTCRKFKKWEIVENEDNGGKIGEN